MSVESVVLLDEHGRVAGTAPKADVHHAQTPLHLAFSLFLFSASGELLLTRRASTKRTFPGLWTNSVCGHPGPGEAPAEAAERRARAEIGARVDGLRLVLPEFAYRAEMDGIVENERCPVYVAWLDESMALEPDLTEVGGVEWVDWPSFVDDVLTARRHVSPWCVEEVRELSALGPDPRRWPEGDEALLPPAARGTAHHEATD